MRSPRENCNNDTRQQEPCSLHSQFTGMAQCNGSERAATRQRSPQQHNARLPTQQMEVREADSERGDPRRKARLQSSIQEEKQRKKSNAAHSERVCWFRFGPGFAGRTRMPEQTAQATEKGECGKI